MVTGHHVTMSEPRADPASVTDALNATMARFKEECRAVHNEVLGSGLRQMYETLSQRLESEIKSHRARATVGDAMYDRVEDEEVTGFRAPGDGTVRPGSRHGNKALSLVQFLAQYPLGDALRESFPRMRSGEKVIIFSYSPAETQYGNQFSFVKDHEYILVTNRAKFLGFTRGASGEVTSLLHRELDFWLPRDYILIIRSLVENLGQRSRIKSAIAPATVLDLLVRIRDTLHDRRYVPLYVADVMAENKALVAKTVDHEEERARLQEERARLQEERARLQEERHMVDADRDAVTRERAKLTQGWEELTRLVAEVQTEREALRSIIPANAVDAESFLRATG